MTDFAVWFSRQANPADVGFVQLQNFAAGNAAAWPIASNNVGDYAAAITAPAAVIPAGASSPALLQTLGRYFENWLRAEASTHRRFWPSVIATLSQNPVISLLGFLGIIVVGALLIGIYTGAVTEPLAQPERARGLITFLIVVTAAAVILMTAIATLTQNDPDKRFTQSKDLITIVIGLLGTILGFYFGSATGVGVAGLTIGDVSLSSYSAAPGDSVTISATIRGGVAPYKYSVSVKDLSTGKDLDQLRISDSVVQGNSISIALKVPEQFSAPGALLFSVTASDNKGLNGQAFGALSIVPRSAAKGGGQQIPAQGATPSAAH